MERKDAFIKNVGIYTMMQGLSVVGQAVAIAGAATTLPHYCWAGLPNMQEKVWSQIPVKIVQKESDDNSRMKRKLILVFILSIAKPSSFIEW